jgi:hypothetical protein
VPESDPLADVGLTFFAVDDGLEYPPTDDNPFSDDLPHPQAMRGSTWVDREKCRARCVHARIVHPGSLSLYAHGKETVWSGLPVCELPTRFAVHCVSRLGVDTEAAAGREENDIYWHPATASLLALSIPVRLLAGLVDFEPLGGRAVELVVGVSCTNLFIVSHKRQ